MLIGSLKASEKFSYLLNLIAFSSKFSSSPPGKGEKKGSKNMISSGQGGAQSRLSPPAPRVLSSDSSRLRWWRDLADGLGGPWSPLGPSWVLVTGHCPVEGT